MPAINAPAELQLHDCARQAAACNELLPLGCYRHGIWLEHLCLVQSLLRTFLALHPKTSPVQAAQGCLRCRALQSRRSRAGPQQS